MTKFACYTDIQLYRHIKREILAGNLSAGEKLPSLRAISKDSGVSLTTVSLAYEQLLTEGYIISRPQSGYYVAELPAVGETIEQISPEGFDLTSYAKQANDYVYDLSAFDFQKWKKCTSKVLNDSRRRRRSPPG